MSAVLIENTDSISRIDFLTPLKDFFENNVNYAENLQNSTDFLTKYYYFRNYLRDLFLKESFIVRGYKGTGKTLLYHALEDPAFVIQLKKFCDVYEDFRFVNIVDKSNILHLSRSFTN